VTATRTDANPTNDIAVANLSLAGQVGPPGEACAGAQHAKLVEICGAVQAGITIVAAAGNESQDFQSLWPATYDGVLAVTAMADSDGQAGGRGPTLPSGCSDAEADDTVAFFSNFATLPDDRVHTVAAPGVCIGSTWPDGLYAIHSGTSFATPLVSGTVALCIASGPCAGLTPRQIIQKVVSDAGAYNTSKNGSGHGFQGDPLRPISGRYYGYLINAGIY
jgi:subtilisin family serine protease